MDKVQRALDLIKTTLEGWSGSETRAYNTLNRLLFILNQPDEETRVLALETTPEEKSAVGFIAKHAAVMAQKHWDAVGEASRRMIAEGSRADDLEVTPMGFDGKCTVRDPVLRRTTVIELKVKIT